MNELSTLVRQNLDKIRVQPGEEQLLTRLPEGRVNLIRRKSDDRLPITSRPVAVWGRDYSQPHGGCWKPAIEIEQNIHQFLTRVKKG